VPAAIDNHERDAVAVGARRAIRTRHTIAAAVVCGVGAAAWAFYDGPSPRNTPDSRSSLSATGGSVAPAALERQAPAEKSANPAQAAATAAQPTDTANDQPAAAASTLPSTADEAGGEQSAKVRATSASKPAADGRGQASGAPRLVTDESTSKPTAKIDSQAAAAALSEAAANAESCKGASSPSGVARVSVVFTSTGHAVNAFVAGSPFAGTVEGKCIATKFRAARIPPYSGDDVTLHKTVDLR
jgi:hypothetical protein